MKVGIITLGQLAETKRWDAAFNLAYQEHKAQMQALQAKHTIEELREFAEVLPFDQSASSVRAGNYSPRDFSRYDNNEIALYLILAGKSIDTQCQSIQAEADNKIGVLRKMQAAFEE